MPNSIRSFGSAIVGFVKKGINSLNLFVINTFLIFVYFFFFPFAKLLHFLGASGKQKKWGWNEHTYPKDKKYFLSQY